MSADGGGEDGDEDCACSHHFPRWERLDAGKWVKVDLTTLRQGYRRGFLTGPTRMRYCLGAHMVAARTLDWTHYDGTSCDLFRLRRGQAGHPQAEFSCPHGLLVRLREPAVEPKRL
jgi:hypothetical protein